MNHLFLTISKSLLISVKSWYIMFSFINYYNLQNSLKVYYDVSEASLQQNNGRRCHQGVFFQLAQQIAHLDERNWKIKPLQHSSFWSRCLLMLSEVLKKLFSLQTINRFHIKSCSILVTTLSFTLILKLKKVKLKY